MVAALVPSQPSTESAMALINGRWCRSGFMSQQFPRRMSGPGWCRVYVFHREEMLGAAFSLNTTVHAVSALEAQSISVPSSFVVYLLKKGKGMFLYSAVSSPLDRSGAAHFTPPLADLFIPTPTRLLWEAF